MLHNSECYESSYHKSKNLRKDREESEEQESVQSQEILKVVSINNCQK